MSSNQPHPVASGSKQKRPRHPPRTNSSAYPSVRVRHPSFITHAHVDPDGLVHISMNHQQKKHRRRRQQEQNRELVQHGQQQQPELQQRSHPIDTSAILNDIKEAKKTPSASVEPRLVVPPPKLNIVIMVIGSRGDIQPFLAIAKELIGGWGHRVRVATHPEFEDMVNEELSGFDNKNGGEGEFFNVGGDPQELMAFMVKNPGLFPSLEAIKKGEINRRREQMAEMFEGFWRACVTPMGGGEGAKKLEELGREEAVKNSSSSASKKGSGGRKKKGVNQRLPGTKPFVADAIIANPPSFAHIHCAERLGIPLHMMFTFPYTPTTTIPHPLANISQSNIEAAYTNLISYSMVEVMTWQGLGDLVNNFRKKTLGLEPLSTLWAPGLLARLKVPTTYMWSPSLIPKPADWGAHIDISGFVFLNKASSFEPPKELQTFLDEEPDNLPIYIGFGSIVVDDPDKLTKLIFEAVEKTGVRALVSKGWGGLGVDEGKLPKSIYMVENTPHDWLFPKCRAVVHHGGAGTTAIGLKCGKPTFIVSFFGDQPFWGTMIKNAGAGSWCPFKDLDLDKLVEGIEVIKRKETEEKAQGMAEKIDLEGDGAKNAVMSFYRSLEHVGVSRMVGGKDHSDEEEEAEEKVQKVEEFDDVEEEEARRVRAEDQQPLVKTSTTAGAAAREGGRGEEDVFNMDETKRDANYPELLSSNSPNSQTVQLSLEQEQPSTTTSMPETFQTIPKELIHTPGIRCNLLPTHVAVWRIKRTEIRLSALAAHILSTHNKLTYKDLRLIRHTEWNGFGGPGEPLSGGFSAIVRTVGSIGKGLVCVPYAWYKSASSHPHSPINDPKVSKIKTKSSKKSKNNKERIDNSKGTVTTTTRGGGEYSEAEFTNISFSHELAIATGASLQAVIHTMLRAPIDFTVSIALGFHNAPLLYGDQVRRPMRITGIQSGLQAAAKEVIFGITDTATGLVIKPYHGAKEGGVIGFLSGVGMGLGGVVFAAGAATFAIPGYTLKGVHKEFRKGTERKLEDRVRGMRVWQGEEEGKVMLRREKEKSDKEGQHGARDTQAQKEDETTGSDGKRRKNAHDVQATTQDILKAWDEELIRERQRRDEAESRLKRDIKSFRKSSGSVAKVERLRKRDAKRVRKNMVLDDLQKQQA